MLRARTALEEVADAGSEDIGFHRLEEEIVGAQVKGAQAALAEARLNLEYTRVQAPISGVAGRALVSEGSLVEAQRTLLTTISQIDPKRAHELMQSGHTYVDVRTVEEYAAGHPAGAVNVPAFLRDAFGQMVPNPDFLPVMQASFTPETPLALGCRMGGRSMRASRNAR